MHGGDGMNAGWEYGGISLLCSGADKAEAGNGIQPSFCPATTAVEITRESEFLLVQDEWELNELLHFI